MSATALTASTIRRIKGQSGQREHREGDEYVHRTHEAGALAGEGHAPATTKGELERPAAQPRERRERHEDERDEPNERSDIEHAANMLAFSAKHLPRRFQPRRHHHVLVVLDRHYSQPGDRKTSAKS